MRAGDRAALHADEAARRRSSRSGSSPIASSAPSTTRRRPRTSRALSGLDLVDRQEPRRQGRPLRAHDRRRGREDQREPRRRRTTSRTSAWPRSSWALMTPPQYNPLFEQRDSTGKYHDRLTDLLGDHRLGRRRRAAQLVRPHATRRVERRGGHLLPAPRRKPYRRKNAPYDSLEELHMVRGVRDDFWATFVDPDPTNPKKRIMTVWGQGDGQRQHGRTRRRSRRRVRRRAARPTLCTDPMQMQMFFMGVTMAHGITMGAPLFGSAQDFVDDDEGPGDARADPHGDGHEAGEVPVGERVREEHHHREQDVLDLRRRRREGLQARDARADPHRRRLPQRAAA